MKFDKSTKIQMMLTKAYLNSEQYDQCEQICNYMNKTFPNDITVQTVGFLFLFVFF